MMTTPERFEDRLLRELRRVVDERPAPAAGPEPRARRTRLAWGGVGVGVVTATAVVAIVASSGDVTPSAYAVQPQANGVVTVSIHSLSDAAGLQSKLRAAGVPAIVSYSTARGAGCLPSGAAAEPGVATPVPGGTTDSSAGSDEGGASPSLTTSGSGPEADGTPGSPGVSGRTRRPPSRAACSWARTG